MGSLKNHFQKVQKYEVLSTEAHRMVEEHKRGILRRNITISSEIPEIDHLSIYNAFVKDHYENRIKITFDDKTIPTEEDIPLRGPGLNRRLNGVIHKIPSIS